MSLVELILTRHCPWLRLDAASGPSAAGRRTVAGADCCTVAETSPGREAHAADARL